LRLEIIGGDFNIDKIQMRSVTTIPVASVAINPTSVSVGAGGTTQLNATVAPSNASNKNVTWTSSNNSVATVNASGLVTGVASGTATITVKTVDGLKTATSTITVTSVVTPPTGAFPGYYNIISRNSNKGLDVADNATNNGARIQQYDIANGGGDNQRWKFVDAGAGNYYIIAKSTQLYLATENNGTGDGVKVVQRSLANSNEFKWTITNLGGGFYKIINLNSGKALDVEGVSTSNGANIQVWTYGGGSNQQWQFNQVEATAKNGVSKNTIISNGTLLYADPKTNSLKINFLNKGEATVELYDLSGKTIFKQQYLNTIGTENSIDLSLVSKGIYIVRVNDENGEYTQKIMKE
jgi:glucosylceramidase